MFEKIIKRFPKVRILVLGDSMLDRFIWGNVSRISPEAPVPVLVVEREEFLLGGAANVVNNLHSLLEEKFSSAVLLAMMRWGKKSHKDWTRWELSEAVYS